MSDGVDWSVVDEALAVADTPEAKQQRDALFRQLDPNRSGSLSLSEVQNGIGKCLESTTSYRKKDEAAKGLIPGIKDYKLPIKMAFKGARQLDTSGGGDSSTVDRTEFHALLVYFRHYLELLVLFKNLDSGGDMTLSAKEICAHIEKLEKYGITSEQVKSKLKVQPKEEISFEHFSEWCVQGKLRGMTFDATEGVKEPKAQAPSKASTEEVPVQIQESPKSSVKARSTREIEADRVRLTQEKMDKMRVLEKDYREKLKKIAQQDSSLKLPDNKLPSFHKRVQLNTQNRIKQDAASDAEYQAWLQQRAIAQDDRLRKTLSERTASYSGLKVKAAEAKLQKQERERGMLGSLYDCQNGLPNGRPPKGSKSVPELGYVPYTPEEMAERLERSLNPIWNKSLKERAAGEREYMKWSAALKANTKCAVDHIFTGERGKQTDAQRDLIENIANEKRYWKWAANIKSTKTCTIDQSWARATF